MFIHNRSAIVPVVTHLEFLLLVKVRQGAGLV